MAITVLPIPTIDLGGAITATIPATGRQYKATREVEPGIYNITLSTSAVSATITFTVGSSVVETTTSAGSVQVNLSSAASEIYYWISSGTNILVTLTKVSTPIDTGEISGGTLDTITTTGAYNTTGKLYVLCVGGGGGGLTGSAGNSMKGGGSGGTHVAKIVYTTTATTVTIGSGGNASTQGGSTTFGNLVTAPGGAAGITISANMGPGNAGVVTTRNALDIVPNNTNGGGGAGGYQNGNGGAGAGSGIGTGGTGGNAAVNSANSGSVGTGYGAGGGGAGSNQNTTGSGGAGTAGVVYVLRDFSQEENMPKYAAIQEDGIVFNTIVAETKEIAESIVGLPCVEYTNEPAEPGGTWDGQKFIPRKPGPDYIWNEDSQSWIEPLVEPVE